MGLRVDFELHDGWVDFVPKAHDNRLDDEPAVFEVSPMTAAEHRAWEARHAPRLRRDGEKYAVTMLTKLLKKRVRNIRNYYVNREITTVDDLLEYGHPAVMDELITAITDMSVLQAGLAKKSDSLSDS